VESGISSRKQKALEYQGLLFSKMVEAAGIEPTHTQELSMQAIISK